MASAFSGARKQKEIARTATMIYIIASGSNAKKTLLTGQSAKPYILEWKLNW